MNTPTEAPGWPGIPPRWSSSNKSGVGAALNPSSRVWFTLSHGILNEIYYPRVDQACTRDLGLIVTDGQGFFSEEKRQTQHVTDMPFKGVPAFRLTNTCVEGRYRIVKQIICDPKRDVLLQSTQFTALKGSLADYHLFALLAPHLGNQGDNNAAWLADYKGVPMLFAQRANSTLALACSTPWIKSSAGFVGYSDGWQDLNQHGLMTWTYDRAENGNVALTGEVDLVKSQGSFIIALGFGLSPAEAGLRVLSSLNEGFETAQTIYVNEWRDWHKTCLYLKPDDVKLDDRNIYDISTAVLRTHESKRFPGGLIASLSIPWGFDKGDDDLGGYHLVWPRDLVEAAGGLLAAGAVTDSQRVLEYLQATQDANGSWPQNMWLDGTPFWGGVQMDETALPILLVNLVQREHGLTKSKLASLWPMVRKAASFLLRNGPVTQEDRWEEDPGYNPFTLATEIAALLVAADLADAQHETAAATFLRETADTWNASIERWIYVTGTSLAQENGVEGFYVRVSPPDTAEAASPKLGFVPIKNRPPGDSEEPASQIISPDALALVRFGLRRPDDPRILNTIKVIDALLKVDTPSGPAWHRYNEDGYGENDDGSPFDGTGCGRAWPLLVGERAHYALAAGHRDEAVALLHAMESMASEGGLIPEQIWDAPDIPENELFFGKPSGSAMPLVWAHAEYIKLLRSLQDGKVFDLPPQTVQRYLEANTPSRLAFWQYNQKLESFPAGKTLRIGLLQDALVRWSNDNWQTYHDVQTQDTGLGVYIADLPTTELPSHASLVFTFQWTGNGAWEGVNYTVQVED